MASVLPDLCPILLAGWPEFMRSMRDWINETMRRRSRRGPNESESTGKSGQELPSGQLAPLRPNYPDPIARTGGRTEAKAEPAAQSAQGSKSQEAAEQESVSKPAVAELYELPIDMDELAPQSGDQTHHDAEPSDLSDTPEGFAPAEPGAATGQMVVETESVGTPPAEQVAVSPKSPRGYVVLTIGLPGSGKTTWYKRRGVSPLSSDMLRTILFDDITDQRYQGLVFSTLRSLLRARLIAKMPWNYVDATNLSPHERRQWIKMAKSFGYEVQAVFFDVPLAVCLERNSKRDRQVTDEVMQKMAERLRPPAFKEGFDKITVVRVKGAPGADASPESTPAPDAEATTAPPES
jgi:predicted kinase